jgi:hypothetical protein
MAQTVERLPSKREALSSNPSTKKKKKKSVCYHDVKEHVYSFAGAMKNLQQQTQ